MMNQKQMRDLDYFLSRGVLAGSRAWSTNFKADADYDIFMYWADVPDDIKRSDSIVNYGQAAGVISVFYVITAEGETINVQTVKDPQTLYKFRLASLIMKQLFPINDKVKRIKHWRHALTMANVQPYREYTTD